VDRHLVFLDTSAWSVAAVEVEVVTVKPLVVVLVETLCKA
jgi:hypothetical protein